ncbi:cyclic-di-AMP phosphodiesterase PgpH [Bacillaceae bacterium]
MNLAFFKRWKISESWLTSTGVRTFLYVLLWLAVFLSLLESVLPETFDLRVGERSPKRIESPVTVVDMEATEKAREQNAQAVAPVFTKQENVTSNQLKILDRIFANVEELRDNEFLSPEEKIAALKEQIPYQLSAESYKTLLELSPETLATMKWISKNIVSEIMLDGVKGIEGLNEARKKVDQEWGLVELEPRARKTAQELAKASIVQNILYDEELTQELREKARQSVKPIMIQKGDVLVDEGEVITEDVYRKLKMVGLLNDGTHYISYGGLALFVSLIVAFLYFYISQSKLTVKNNNLHLAMLITLFVSNVIVMKILTLGQNLDFATIGFFAPAAFATMLISLLLDLPLALICSVMFAVISSVIFHQDTTALFDFRYGLVTLISCITGAYALRNARRRATILRSGFVVAGANVLSIGMLYLLIYPQGTWREITQSLVFGACGGLLAAVLAIGLMPFCEAAFGILSVMKLIELSNLNHPLLRRLLIETPGTYHHSIIVANLAEAAAESIGANGLLARVGAYYHDVGKMKRPQFFIENQFNMANPHDKLSPRLSKTIITAHPYDGVKMLKEYNIPQAICDIAEQHHGTTLLKYFYHKAMQQSDGEVLESEYRYPGPKAQFKEAAIVGICDSVEAAVRSLAKPTPDRIETLVRRIIKERLEDGQFNECDITLKELETVAKSICETLHGTFHSRIQYPDDLPLKEVKEA